MNMSTHWIKKLKHQRVSYPRNVALLKSSLSDPSRLKPHCYPSFTIPDYQY
jgi:hypothetical protein